jgi:hypothetical protein
MPDEVSAARRAAFHEAGHMAAMHLHGREIRSASIVPDEWSAGQVRDHLPDVVTDTGAAWQPWEEVLILLAGPEAEGQFVGDVAPYSATDDERKAGAVASSWTYSQEEADAFLAWLRLRVRTFITHAHVRFLIEHLAAALMRDREMDAADIKIEIERAAHRWDRLPPEDRLPTPEDRR